MDHGSNQHQVEDPAVIVWNQRLGLKLFAIYAAVYFLYIVICVAWVELLDATWVLGIPNSVVFGFGLILLALVIALIYGLFCRLSDPGSPTEGRR